MTRLVLAILFAASLVTAQSLTELAQKEKERRAHNAAEGKTAVVDIGEGTLGTEDPAGSDGPAVDMDAAEDDDVEEIETFEAAKARMDELKEEYAKYAKRCSEDREDDNVPSSPSCEKIPRIRAELEYLRRRFR